MKFKHKIIDFVNKLLYHKDTQEVFTMANSLYISNNILELAFNDDIDITPMKLQKLLYFVYKKHYQETGVSLFPERFEAWRYGPVLSNVYEQFKKYGANHIDDYATDKDGKVFVVNLDTDPELKNAIDYVWHNYKDCDGIYLSTLTHKKDTAWYKAVESDREFLYDVDIGKEEWLA